MILDKTVLETVLAQEGISMNAFRNQAAKACADALLMHEDNARPFLILIGSGNNGRIGLHIASYLKKVGRTVSVFFVEGKAPASIKAIEDNDIVSSVTADSETVLVDAVKGADEDCTLSAKEKALFQTINDTALTLYSIEINSGTDADSDHVEADALRSHITFTIGGYRLTHLFSKEHHLFDAVETVAPLPDSTALHSPFHIMNEELFFQSFPRKTSTSWKGSHGRILLINGCTGMAGAACLNLVGAKTVGASYILDALPESIYPIVASRFLTPVYHPFTRETWYEVIEPLICQVRAIGFGSGAVYMEHKLEILDLLLQNAACPIVLDGEALRMLKYNTFILRFAKAPVILTPHIGEFEDFCGIAKNIVEANRLAAAKQFASDYHVYVVLKGPNTIAVSPCGDVYINQSGNAALAQAGSGDVLTGILTALLSMTSDVDHAIRMAVWLHGYLAQLGTEDAEHSMQNFDITRFPQLMDKLFAKHGY